MPSLNILLVLLLLLLIGGFAAVIFLLIRNRHRTPVGQPDLQVFLTQMNELRRELQTHSSQQRVEVGERLDKIHNNLMRNLTDSSQTLQQHFSHTQKIIGTVTERLTKLDETNKQVLQFSTQLQSLEDILKNPKQRGILGEYWLETLLGQVLQPGQYEMQHKLGTDEGSGAHLIPDAVIFIKNTKVPIDAKFSLENYNRLVAESDPKRRDELERQFKSDVKMRIDETSKYIRPQMGTTDFAFMFVPAEGVYHNLLTTDVGAAKVNSRNLIEYAFEKKVMIVSSTPFFAYLQTVVMGLNALQIEDSVKEIQKRAEDYMRHLKAYEDHHNRLGKHLDTVSRAYKASSKELRKLDKDIFKITDGKAGKELEILELGESSLTEK